jgi:hypothetical protein
MEELEEKRVFSVKAIKTGTLEVFFEVRLRESN